MSSKYNIGLVGLGAISRYYVNAVKENDRTELVAVCDVRKPDQEKFPQSKAYDDYKQMIDQEDVQVVAIATPPNTHHEIITYALSKGRRVIVEKPITINLEDGKKCQAEDPSGDKLYMAYHAAFAPTYLEAKKFVIKERDSGDPVVHFHVIYKEDSQIYHPGSSWVYNPAVSGGGCLIDSGINAISFVEDLLGEMKPTSVEISTAEGYKVETKAVVKFQSTSDSNLTGDLEMDWRCTTDRETRYAKITFKSGATVEFDFVTAKVDITRDGKTTSHQVDAKEDVDIMATPMGLEYTNVLIDALNFFEGKSKTHLGLMPFLTIMECYKIVNSQKQK